jgi:hypothetical protein
VISPFYEHATEILRRGHQFAADAAKLKALAPEYHPEEETIRTIATGIDRRARELRLLPVEELDRAYTLREIVHMCVESVTLTDVIWDTGGLPNQDMVPSTKYSPSYATTLKNAVQDVVENAKRYRQGPVRIWIGTSVWAGLPHEVVSLTNQASDLIGALRAANAFRQPIVSFRPPGEGGNGAFIETRLGAFTAGALVRGLGGDVYLASDRKTIRVTLMIPTPYQGNI